MLLGEAGGRLDADVQLLSVPWQDSNVFVW
jgi:hypothetical protein